MSSLTHQEMKILQRVEAKARLAQQNKDAARAHLLTVQALLAQRPIIAPKPLS